MSREIDTLRWLFQRRKFSFFNSSKMLTAKLIRKIDEHWCFLRKITIERHWRNYWKTGFLWLLQMKSVSMFGDWLVTTSINYQILLTLNYWQSFLFKILKIWKFCKGGGPIKELLQSFSCISSEIREITEHIKEVLQKTHLDIDYFLESKKK